MWYVKKATISHWSAKKKHRETNGKKSVCSRYGAGVWKIANDTHNPRDRETAPGCAVELCQWVSGREREKASERAQHTHSAQRQYLVFGGIAFDAKHVIIFLYIFIIIRPIFIMSGFYAQTTIPFGLHQRAYRILRMRSRSRFLSLSPALYLLLNACNVYVCVYFIATLVRPIPCFHLCTLLLIFSHLLCCLKFRIHSFIADYYNRQRRRKARKKKDWKQKAVNDFNELTLLRNRFTRFKNGVGIHTPKITKKKL